jgi:hypothetical protein
MAAHPPEIIMSSLPGKAFRFCAIAACSVIVANGCMLDRRPIVSPGTVVPAEYCPGDTLTASYDFLRFAGGVCTPRAGAPDECTTAAPTVTMTSTPALFPPTTLQSYQNSISFAASGDRVDVGFAYGTGSIFVPPSTLLVTVRDNTDSATRIIGTVETVLPHMGSCSRSFVPPSYAPVEVPGTSPGLGLTGVCNPASNGATVNYVLSTDAPGETFSVTLAPGECFGTASPGVPAFVSRARVISAAPVGLLCPSGGDGTTMPLPNAPPLATRVQQACR